MKKLLIGGILAGACLVPLAASAGVSVNLGLGVPAYAPEPVYYDPPPPVVYAPPAPAYYPPPVVYGEPGVVYDGYYGPRYYRPYGGYYRHW